MYSKGDVVRFRNVLGDEFQGELISVSEIKKYYKSANSTNKFYNLRIRYTKIDGTLATANVYSHSVIEKVS